VVAGGNHIHAVGQQFPGGPQRQTETPGGVFTIGDYEIDVELLDQAGQKGLDGEPARSPDDITDG
jgi:hypothetical protein